MSPYQPFALEPKAKLLTNQNFLPAPFHLTLFPFQDFVIYIQGTVALAGLAGLTS
jgi:hypothetical protein